MITYSVQKMRNKKGREFMNTNKDAWEAAGPFPMQKLVDTIAKIMMARYDGTVKITGTVAKENEPDEEAAS